MESENNLKKKQKLEVSDILKAAIIIYVKNFNFMIFTFLTSLPLFCIMVYFEIQLQETIVETFHIVNSKDVDVHHSYTGSILDYFMNNYYYLKLIQLGLIYIFPLHVLEFGTAIITVDLASKLGSQQEKKMTLKRVPKKRAFSDVDFLCMGTVFEIFLLLCWRL
ncbi:uncharacterized protein [Medicago truncatula]|uniref:uncharacterized protein isoform X2 n=1 Tax=Medicago truncatula TaxID=3880 RepID=UPI000D2F2C5D|nr:uncharacterized protein LOC25501296 isoform X2 [Medicago truncatula]